MTSRTSPEIRSQDVSSSTLVQASENVVTTARDESPEVSVIIPCYNGEKLIEDAIESVLNQTYQNFEIIIVDDCSTDNSKSVIERYLVDDRVKFIQHEKNRGIPAARNTAIEESKGQYLALLDHDDKWVSNKLELQLERFGTDREAGLVFGNITLINADDQTILEPKKKLVLYAGREKNLRKLFIKNFIPSVTVAFKRECLKKVGRFDERITWGGDDYDLWLRIAGKFNIVYINEVLAVRRLHKNNYSDPERMLRGEMKLINPTLEMYPFLEDLKDEKVAWIKYSLGRCKHLEGDFVGARKLYLETLARHSAVSWKACAAFLLALVRIRFDRRGRMSNDDA